MKNAEREGIVLVIIWAVVAVALSFLAEARGNQTTDPMPLTQDANVQLSTTTVGYNIVGAARTDTLDQRAEEITEANWQQHPKIRTIRNMVSSVDAGLKKGIFKTSQRKFDWCDEGYEVLRRMDVDARGIVRRYEMQGGTEDHARTYQYYYDESARLRFVFISGGATNGTVIQHRIYFDEKGKRIWEAHKLVEGPGYPGLCHHCFPDEELQMSDPDKAFAAATPCPEIKPKSRRRAR